MIRRKAQDFLRIAVAGVLLVLGFYVTLQLVQFIPFIGTNSRDVVIDAVADHFITVMYLVPPIALLAGGPPEQIRPLTKVELRRYAARLFILSVGIHLAELALWLPVFGTDHLGLEVRRLPNYLAQFAVAVTVVLWLRGLGARLILRLRARQPKWMRGSAGFFTNFFMCLGGLLLTITAFYVLAQLAFGTPWFRPLESFSTEPMTADKAPVTLEDTMGDAEPFGMPLSILHGIWAYTPYLTVLCSFVALPFAMAMVRPLEASSWTAHPRGREAPQAR